MIIKRAVNGLIVKHEGETRVFADTDEIPKFEDFLYFIIDALGPATSRYSPERIQITVVPGDKYE